MHADVVTFTAQGMNTMQAACLAAWAVGCALTFRHYLLRWARRTTSQR